MSRRRIGHAALTCALAVLLSAGAIGRASADPSPTSGPTSSPTFGSSATPSVPPSGAAQAQSAANDATARVATLRIDVRTASSRLQSATAAADLAQTSYAAAVEARRRARSDVHTARLAVTTAEAIYARDHQEYVAVVATSYEQGGALAGTASLLTAPDPGRLIMSADLSQSVARYRTEVVSRDTTAAATAHAAQTRLESALAVASATSARLKTASDTAARTQLSAAGALRRLQRQLAGAKATQQAADAVLSRFLGGWSVADPARAQALNRHYLDLARKNVTDPMAPAGRAWTAEQGQSVVWRSLMWIGTPYAWAGGNASGPTVGVCAGGGAQNDCHVTGFDCSGLALYGWAPYLSMPHLASTQYVVAGHQHPDVAHLLPGDLVFWSSNGTVGGIHHVAIYIGDGNVLQAPQSGDIVRVTPLGSVDSGYYGATRPRT